MVTLQVCLESTAESFDSVLLCEKGQEHEAYNHMIACACACSAPGGLCREDAGTMVKGQM